MYIHGLAARGVHYLHRPGPTLQDAGFFLLPELGQDKGYISETVFTCLFLSFVLASQFLRIITFYSTQLPGPNYHCRESLLIIASRKHYTVDVVVAWYTVNLVVFFISKKLPELPDRTSGAASLLLPLSTKDRDIKNKEENHKLLNGNSVDPDRRQRTQVNGKILEDANGVIADANGMNGFSRLMIYWHESSFCESEPLTIGLLVSGDGSDSLGLGILLLNRGFLCNRPGSGL
ncbi:hypothetical protein GH714_015903 [Hevea brasiliensis]|uniref:Sphingomyelin synthase-like domain-containing protein n=1 Tax=Hevea brasiliensis TaxID=3981 RepID=A0A6A6LXP4_HEVBR|nr:hypothetical protein GH714_015903 [Hevea brasiliensis]